MKIAFFGTPRFSVPVLDALINSNHEVAVVITQPDRPVGRNQELGPTPVKQVALKHNIKILQPESVKQSTFFDEFKKFNVDLGIIVAFGQIIPENIIYLPRYHTVNIHASLLPKYRGAAPINAAVINGDTETGITYQFIDKGLDTGDILLQEKLLIGLKDSSVTLYEKLSNLSADTVLKAVDMIKNEDYMLVKQDNSKATVAKSLKKEDGKIDFNKSTLEIYNLVRGLLPWPGAFCVLGSRTLKVWSSSPLECGLPAGDYKPGHIADISKECNIVVKTGNGFISLNEVQMEGGRRLDGYLFSLGQRDLKGKILL